MQIDYKSIIHTSVPPKKQKTTTHSHTIIKAQLRRNIYTAHSLTVWLFPQSPEYDFLPWKKKSIGPKLNESMF